MFFSRHVPIEEHGDKLDAAHPSVSRATIYGRTKRFWIAALVAFVVILGIALGVGIGLGLKKSDDDSDDDGGSSFVPPTGNTTTPGVNGTYWQPQAGATWQIVLAQPLTSFSPDVSIFDVDLFENNASTIAQLHSQNKRVICYFSAGSYESVRPDSKNFSSTDYGKKLKGWPKERWLDTTSANVRAIMKSRIQLASELGCDGVDPDNVDGFANDSGFPLTDVTAIDFLTYLATEAHALKLAIGLKNAGAIVNQTTGFLQWVVNEQCGQFKECALYQPFIDADKPVFHIEYVGDNGSAGISTQTKNGVCEGGQSEEGFSTVMKKMDLGDWVEVC